MHKNLFYIYLISHRLFKKLINFDLINDSFVTQIL